MEKNFSASGRRRKFFTCGKNLLPSLAGFTIAELLVVLAIVSILISGVVFWFFTEMAKIRNRKCLAKLHLTLVEAQESAHFKKTPVVVEINGSEIHLSGAENKTVQLQGCNFTPITLGVSEFGIFNATVEIKNLNAPEGEPTAVEVHPIGVFSP